MELFVDTSTFVHKCFNERLEFVFKQKNDLYVWLMNDPRKSKALDNVMKQIRSVEVGNVMIKRDSLRTLVHNLADVYAKQMINFRHKELSIGGKDKNLNEYLDKVSTDEGGLEQSEDGIRNRMKKMGLHYGN